MCHSQFILILFMEVRTYIPSDYVCCVCRDGEEFYEQIKEFLVQWVPAYRSALSFNSMTFVGGAATGGGRGGGGSNNSNNNSSSTSSATATVSRIRDMDFNANAVYDSIQANNNNNNTGGRFNRI